jgi:hypothetical protein
MNHALLEAARSAVSGTNRNALLREYAALLRRGVNDPASVADLQRLGGLLGKGLGDVAADVAHLSTFDTKFAEVINLPALQAEATNQQAAADKAASDYAAEVKSAVIRRDNVLKTRDAANAAVQSARLAAVICNVLRYNRELFTPDEAAPFK